MEPEDSIRIDEVINLFRAGDIDAEKAMSRIEELWNAKKDITDETDESIPTKKKKFYKKKSSEQVRGEKKMKADLHDLTEALDEAIPEEEKKDNRDKYDETTAKEMLSLKKQGMTFAAIAEKYQVSAPTVKSYILRLKPDEKYKL